jgi:hypothetical protein
MLQNGNRWGTSFCSFGECSGISITEILGEETINGETYKIMGNNTCLMREENGIVYVLNEDQTEDVFIDFTLEIGDSYFTDSLQDNCLNMSFSNTNEIRITDTQTINILGEDRKVLFMDYYDDGFQIDLDGQEEIWIEGIGSTQAIGPGGFAFDNDIFLNCFTNNGSTVRFSGNIITNNTSDCIETTAGVDEYLLNQINLSPMPVLEKANLKIPLEIIDPGVIIFDMNGEILYELKISKLNTELNFSSFSSGMYFYQIYSENKLIATKKLIIR